MIEKIGVIGAGTMGFGIAFQFITNGKKVILQDINEKSLPIVKEKFRQYLQIFREEGILFELNDEQIENFLTLTTNLEALKSCDLIIETATENLELKQEIFKQLDIICEEKTIFTSNTSSLKLSDIAKNVEKHRDKVMLTHFFNPAHIVPLVELLRTTETSNSVFETVKNLMAKIGKVTIEVQKEIPGLVANRIQIALAREALSLLEDGIVSENDLEKAIFAGPGFRFSSSGLLKIMDFGGLDVWQVVLNQLQSEIESNVREYNSLQEKVETGNLGVKTSKGYFEYPGKGLDQYVIERDRALVQQLKVFTKINGGVHNA